MSGAWRVLCEAPGCDSPATHAMADDPDPAEFDLVWFWCEDHV